MAGFSENVSIISDLESALASWCQLTGWEPVVTGEVPEGLLRFWQLPAGASGREALLRAPGAAAGYLRLVELAGCAQQLIRPNPQPWDTGGILDLNLRVSGMAERAAEFGAAGWRGPCDPVAWSFGGREVCEWLAIGPQQLAVALIERLSPPLPAAELPARVGPIFNSSQVVRDMPASLAFYEQVLGFQRALHIRQPLLPAPGPNPLGIPHNLVSEIDTEIAILSPDGNIDGSVELICMHGLSGCDFASRARPPNLGMLGLRFPVSDWDGLLAKLKSAGQSVTTATVALPPYGECRLLALQAPEGAWLEFYQPL